MDFLIPETIEHVTRFGMDIPVLNPAQISALSTRELLDPNFYFINKVDLEMSEALSYVMNKVEMNSVKLDRVMGQGLISNETLSTISTIGIGAVIGAVLGYSLSSDENETEFTVRGAVCGASVGFLLSQIK